MSTVYTFIVFIESAGTATPGISNALGLDF